MSHLFTRCLSKPLSDVPRPFATRLRTCIHLQSIPRSISIVSLLFERASDLPLSRIGAGQRWCSCEPKQSPSGPHYLGVRVPFNHHFGSSTRSLYFVHYAHHRFKFIIQVATLHINVIDKHSSIERYLPCALDQVDKTNVNVLPRTSL